MDQQAALKAKAIATLASLGRAAGYLVAMWLTTKLHVPSFAQSFISDSVAQLVLEGVSTAALAGICWLHNAAAHNEKLALIETAVKLPTTATIDEVIEAAKAQAVAKAGAGDAHGAVE